MIATPDQKRALAMAATDANGMLVRLRLGRWVKLSKRTELGDNPWAHAESVDSRTIAYCESFGWLELTASQKCWGHVVAYAVKITPAGAEEALKP